MMLLHLWMQGRANLGRVKITIHVANKSVGGADSLATDAVLEMIQ
jgi:hypothetical protein